MKYRVTIRTSSGSQEKQEIEAASRFEVYTAVGKSGGTVLALTEVGEHDLSKYLNISFGSGIKQQQIIVMTKNLSAMLAAGLSLSRALSVLERQSNNKRLKAVVADLSESVKKGSPFNEALAQHKNVFSDLYIAMTKAGEESGSVSSSLDIVSTQMERSDNLRRKIRGAMIYPSIVIFAIIIVSVLMMIFVVPTLTSTFKGLGVKVPLATQVITDISDFMVANVALVFIGLGALFLGGYLFARSRPGRHLILAVSLYLPVIGELVRETFAARTARTLSSLLGSGVSVIESITITGEVLGDNAFSRVLTEAKARVEKGDPISSAFADHPKLYPILMSDMAAVGEETGTIADMLKKVAIFYEDDVEQKTKDLSTIIEPVLMLLIGAVVGVFAVSMIAPIYSLSSSIG